MGVCQTKKFKELYEAQLEFIKGCEGLRKNLFCGGGGGMDIFWNYTINNTAINNRDTYTQ